MNPYQIMAIIACCAISVAGIVTLLSMQGVHVLLAVLGVYLFIVLLMIGMQRRARENFEHTDDSKVYQYQRRSLIRSSAKEFQNVKQY